jgi:thymidylate kinase
MKNRKLPVVVVARDVPAVINKYIIEGLDRLGKSTLVSSIQNELGFFQSIHFGKPQKLKFYETKDPDGFVSDGKSAYFYQRASFDNMFRILNSTARVIFDRAHLGECVYSPIYRNYSGNYVYDLERDHGMASNETTKLILLVEDLSISEHFVDDGLSFDISKRQQEQDLFEEAFYKSIIANKQLICVTDPETGQFRSKEDILKEALQ